MIKEMMINMMPNDKSMIKEMIAIIFGFGFVVAVFDVFFAKNPVYSLLGLTVGCVLAVYMLLYMNIVLFRCMESIGNDPKAIEKYVIRHSVIRYMSVVLVFGVVCITNIVNPITCFIGLLGLKAAAYLQPVIHKLRVKKTVG